MLSFKKDEPIINSRKFSIDLCFYSELIICGLFSQHDSLPLLGTVLVMLTSDKKFLSLNVIISFCKHCGYDFAGLVPKTTRILSDQYRIPVPRSKVLSAEKQENVKALFKNYYSSLNQHVLETLREMQIIEKQNKQILSLKGELSRDKMMKKELLHSVFQGLSAGANSLSEILDLPLPDLPETNCLEDSNSLLDAEDVWQNIWEDEESRLFYTQFPDLKEYFPNGFNKQCADTKNSQNVEANPLDKLNKSKENSDKEIELLNKNEEQENSILNSSLETYLQHLPLCVNKLMIDNAAIEFLLYYNSKLGRKRLLRTLFTVNRTRYDLLPLYGRLVSILNQAIPEIAHNLNQSLKTEVDRQIKKKDQVNIESKVRSVRFIGELVNQQVFSKYDVLQILKLLLEDFSHHHIEMACNLLDTCGRFLFRSMDSHHLTKKYLEQMMRVKSKTILDSRYVYMIESTYYLVNPPEVTPTKSSTKPSLHMFIEKIIFQDLMNFSSDTDVLKLLRSLNWDCEVTCAFTIQCLSSPHKLKYQRIDLLAELVAELMDYQEDIGFLVVDAVLEDIRFGMEVNLPIMNQRRISMIKYLGELYAYEVLENDVLFNVLYSLLTFGVSMDPEKPSSIDPPLNMFRIKLIITLLKTCCRYLIDDYSQQKLNCFFIYFQRYYWFKRSSLVLTKDLKSVAFLEETFLDAQFLMRIEFRLAKNYAEAVEAVKKLNKKLRFDILGSNEEYAMLETLTEEIEEKDNTEKEVKLFKGRNLRILNLYLGTVCICICMHVKNWVDIINA
uniref:MIF4G domain-containing protein n=1 Tax=Clastoptera arizonana TaxID=38151 RepID=A0A1B6EE97_9HEMI